MGKVTLNKPALFILYGFPGAGKTHFARELSETLNTAHIQSDRIRSTLFDTPRHDKQENDIVSHLMEYMTEEFLSAGVSVIFDTNAMRLVQRRALREIGRRANAVDMLIWLQIDTESAFARIGKRDRRKSDDKFATPYDRAAFDNYITHMQNPQNEDYTVISGKHTFNMQRSAVVKKLYEKGLITADSATSNMVKPGMVNLVPKSPPKNFRESNRHNIIIR